MSYLLPAEYEAYGLAADTTDDLVTTASALIEAHCRRPTLLAAQYTERIRLTAGAQTARLSYGPLQPGALVSARVRYAKGRRGEYADFNQNPITINLEMGLEIATAFGLPGTWSALDVTTIDVYAQTRELTFPANFLGLGYNEAEVTYTAGFVTVPAQIKVACAQIVRNAQATPAMNVSRTRLDTMQMYYFAGTLIDAGTASLLTPFRAERLG
jgi:hypothetical protein